MPAQILKPSNFDPAKKYPGHPATFMVGRRPRRSATAGSAHVLLQHAGANGYVVAVIDNRGATAISKKLENTIAMRIHRLSETNDLVAGVQVAEAAAVGGWRTASAFMAGAAAAPTR